MSPPWIESGSPASPIWIVGEAPGQEEIAQGRPLVGRSGMELDWMLHEAGWTGLDTLFRTNVCHEHPPSYQHPRTGKWIHNDIEQFFPGKVQAARDSLSAVDGRFPRQPVLQGLEHLRENLNQHHPQLVISIGGTPLWALCQKEGITKWRGSVLPSRPAAESPPTKVVATFHPADVLRQWTHRPLVVQDLRRALREYQRGPSIQEPQWDFTIAPTLAQVKGWLIPFLERRTPLVCDTEGWGVVDAIGFACSARRAICIPFVVEEPGLGDGTCRSYWTPAEEEQVFALLHRVLTECPITFHNAIWDCQVIGKNWGYLPCLRGDTMVAQHTLFPGLLGGKIDPITGRVDKKGSSLSLSFIASMYCDLYRYWKDDGRVRNSGWTNEQYWRYNCEDCARTWECEEVLLQSLDSARLREQYKFEMSLFGPVLKMMFRGVRVDRDKALVLQRTIRRQRDQEQGWLDEALGYPLVTGSWPQVQALFYQDLGVKPQLHRMTKRPTMDDAALEATARGEPLLLPLIRRIQNIRSLNTNEANFIRPALAARGRLRTCFNIAGAETFRFSSNETAFGEGGNMQNLTRPTED